MRGRKRRRKGTTKHVEVDLNQLPVRLVPSFKITRREEGEQFCERILSGFISVSTVFSLYGKEEKRATGRSPMAMNSRETEGYR